jgi:hypothetical protein
VIAWPQLPQAPVLAAEFTANAVGLALEHSLQLRLSPLANTEQRKPDGNWRERSWAASRSRGARLASQIEDLTQAVQAEWDTAARTKPGDEQHSPTCRVVFPEALLAPPTR